MLWLQENWIIAVVGLLVAAVLLWWLFGRSKPQDIAPPAAAPTTPAKPLEPAKPAIIAAEPARFKPIEPTPAAQTPDPIPVSTPPVAAEPVTAEPAATPAAAPPAPALSADNLQLLKGVGPKLAALLNGLGVTSFQQIAAWTTADVAAIEPQLGAFQGRIGRDNIVDQAAYLARGDKAGFEAKYGALGSEL